MRSHYTYSPFYETPVLSGVLYMKASKDIFLSMAEAMLIFRQQIRNDLEWLDLHFSRLEPIDTRSQEHFDSFIGLCIQDLIRNTRSYYEMWLLRHMLRVTILIVFDLDIYLRHRNYERQVE